MPKQGQRTNLPDGNDILNMLGGGQATSERTLALDAIRLDGGTQPRDSIDQETVQDYAEAMERGDVFPAVIVFYDGANYWLGDGFHRWHAAQAARKARILADIRQGTQRDAQLFSVGVNATHGKRRTNADKQRAVMRLLGDQEWSQWSDREIARRCKVSNNFVSRLRSSLIDAVTGDVSVLEAQIEKIADMASVDVDTVQQAAEQSVASANTRKVQRGDQVYKQRVSSQQRAASRPPSPAPKPSQRQEPVRTDPKPRVFSVRVRDKTDIEQLARRIEELVIQDRDGYGFDVEVKKA